MDTRFLLALAFVTLTCTPAAYPCAISFWTTPFTSNARVVVEGHQVYIFDPAGLGPEVNYSLPTIEPDLARLFPSLNRDGSIRFENSRLDSKRENFVGIAEIYNPGQKPGLQHHGLVIHRFRSGEWDTLFVAKRGRITNLEFSQEKPDLLLVTRVLDRPAADTATYANTQEVTAFTEVYQLSTAEVVARRSHAVGHSVESKLFQQVLVSKNGRYLAENQPDGSMAIFELDFLGEKPRFNEVYRMSDTEMTRLRSVWTERPQAGRTGFMASENPRLGLTGFMDSELFSFARRAVLLIRTNGEIPGATWRFRRQAQRIRAE